MARKWNSGDATKYINAIARHLSCDLLYTEHAKKQMEKRGIITGDVMYVLKNGFVHKEAQKSTRDRYYKYIICCKTPNSSRTVCLVVTATRKENKIKVITVMWKDENRG